VSNQPIGNNGFEPEYFEKLFSLEASNFWFQARNLLITYFLKFHCPEMKSFLEIGCGTGFVLSGVAKAFPNTQLYGGEFFTEGLSFAKKRVPKAKLMQLDARAIPFKEQIDTIGAFDVLEHIEEDEVVLSEIFKALNPGGTVIITVPQHRWLWSATDDFARHVRRYTAKELTEKALSAGFTIKRSISFVSLLLPLMMISRLRRQKASSTQDLQSELKLPKWLNSILFFVMQVEMALIKLGLNLPIGGSRLIILQKS